MNVFDKATNWLADLQATELVLMRELGKVRAEKERVGVFMDLYRRFDALEESRPDEGEVSSGPVAPEVRDTLASATRLPEAGPETIPGNHAEAAEEEVEVALVASSSAQPSQAADAVSPADSTPANSSAGTEGEADRQPISADHVAVVADSDGGIAATAPVATLQEPSALAPTDDPRSEDATRKDASSPAPEPTVRERVKALHNEHPEYTRRQAREVLGLSVGSLDGTSHSLGIKWAREEPSSDPITPDETVTDIIQARPKAKAGKLFWLRDSDGQYLNRYCSAMTRNRKEAWTGTEAQIMGCRRNYKIARDLREMPVEKEQAVV